MCDKFTSNVFYSAGQRTDAGKWSASHRLYIGRVPADDRPGAVNIGVRPISVRTPYDVTDGRTASYRRSDGDRRIFIQWPKRIPTSGRLWLRVKSSRFLSQYLHFIRRPAGQLRAAGRYRKMNSLGRHRELIGMHLWSWHYDIVNRCFQSLTTSDENAIICRSIREYLCISLWIAQHQQR